MTERLDAEAEEVRTITRLLQRVGAGDAEAWDPLLAHVHALLHGMAHRQLANERAGHLLQTTALVNEAWLRLASAGDSAAPFAARNEFFCAAASAMRWVLVDEARRRKALKRGGARHRVTVSQIAEAAVAAPDESDLDVEALDRALAAFESDERHHKKARVVELRYFVGLTLEQTAEALGVSLATVKRDFEFARAWLGREIERAARI